MSSDIDLTQQIDLRTPVVLEAMTLDDPACSAAIAVEQKVFLQRFGNTPEDFRREYGPFDARSGFGVASRSDSVLAAARFAWAEPGESLKTLEDAKHFDADVEGLLESVGGVERLLDVLTISATDHSPGTDGRSLGGTLTQAMCFLAARSRSKSHVVAILDDLILAYLIDEFGAPFETMPGAKSRPYLGSGSSTPAICSVDAFADSVFGDLARIANDDSGSVGIAVAASLLPPQAATTNVVQ